MSRGLNKRLSVVITRRDRLSIDVWWAWNACLLVTSALVNNHALCVLWCVLSLLVLVALCVAWCKRRRATVYDCELTSQPQPGLCLKYRLSNCLCDCLSGCPPVDRALY